MSKVAVVGANGQVGTELCLRLMSRDDVEVIPIVRNRAGSAYLRSQGVQCRHGSVAEIAEASELIGDCQTVINLAHADSYLAAPRRLNGYVQDVINRAAPTEANIVFVSTQMVYAPELPVRLPATYGAEKLIIEKRAGRQARQLGKSFVVLRLGHVLGELQSISRKISAEVRDGPVPLVNAGLGPSNTTFVASFAEAVVKINRGSVAAGTYDLITNPQWSWAQVYQFYADQLGESLEIVSTPSPAPITKRVVAGASGKATELLLKQRVRERAAFAMRWVPEEIGEALYANYQIRRARSEIGQLEPTPESVVEPWRAVGRRPLRLSPPQRAMVDFPLSVRSLDLAAPSAVAELE